MPFWVANPEVDDEAAVPAGELLAETVVSRALLGQRRLWSYLPPGYSAATDTLYPVMTSWTAPTTLRKWTCRAFSIV